METFFAFTDESGQYQKIRSVKFNRTHPFYVRSTVIISLNDYVQLQNGIDEIKVSYGLNPRTEIKWSHYGSSLKGNYTRIPHQLTSDQLVEYYSKSLALLCSLNSVSIYYTLTQNNIIGQVNEISLLKMHLQNAYQKIQNTISEKDGFAIVIADDLNDKTKALKQAIYELTLTGDYVQYTNIKKGLYVDYSDQCHGLQLADICAGVFAATLKYESTSEEEKNKFECGHSLFFSKIYKKTRSSFFHSPYYDVYKFGVKEIPSGVGATIAKSISLQIESKLESDLYSELFNN